MQTLCLLPQHLGDSIADPVIYFILSHIISWHSTVPLNGVLWLPPQHAWPSSTAPTALYKAQQLLYVSFLRRRKGNSTHEIWRQFSRLLQFLSCKDLRIFWGHILESNPILSSHASQELVTRMFVSCDGFEYVKNVEIKKIWSHFDLKSWVTG